MTFLDFLVLIPLCWFGFKGFKNGLIYEITTLVALILGAWLSYRFANVISLCFSESTFAKPMAFILIFVSVVLLVHFAGKLVEKSIKLVIPGFVDHLLGLLFGICKVMVVFSVFFFVIESIDRHQILIKPETKEKSVAYQYVEPIIPHALSWKENLVNTDEE